ncbi:hypothetical protein C0J52_26066 [Blattella germanica]|nr:hypothetical protein C0J52_26066 [Blattella germanica]
MKIIHYCLSNSRAYSKPICWVQGQVGLRFESSAYDYLAFDDSLGVCSIHLPAEYRYGMDISEFVLVCIIPLVIIAVTSIITSYRIRKSIKNIPGERCCGHNVISSVGTKIMHNEDSYRLTRQIL